MRSEGATCAVWSVPALPPPLPRLCSPLCAAPALFLTSLAPLAPLFRHIEHDGFKELVTLKCEGLRRNGASGQCGRWRGKGGANPENGPFSLKCPTVFRYP